ncbi:hypothetical protein DSM112329_00686 [Paraconexibacter sp. AEG42_29]|uniref:Uncharacterized protein n=1 Tax=Paraconexibacter sp. AEG42_29 TaxID=2997339 RepID=A0AAU7AQ98_9ACTN
MSVPRRLSPALAAAAAVLAGCASEPTAVVDKDAVLRVKVDEYRITPQNITVQATTNPQRIKVVATNVGKLTHTVKIERVEDEDEEPDEEAVVAPVEEEPDIVGTQAGNAPPGGEARSGGEDGDDLLLEPGEYRLADTIGNHENLGAYGSLTILPPKTG